MECHSVISPQKMLESDSHDSENVYIYDRGRVLEFYMAGIISLDAVDTVVL